MTEKSMNTLLRASAFRIGGWAHKIKDPSFAELRGGTNKRPFDSFGFLPTYNFVFESKFMVDYHAFNFRNCLESHQVENLTNIYDVSKKQKQRWPDSGAPLYCFVVLGVYLSRKFFDTYFFSIEYLNSLSSKGKFSFYAKELLRFKEEGRFLKLENGIFDLLKVPEVAFYE